MRSRMRCSRVGWVARSSDSVHPVHSCADNQITGGRLGFVIASAISLPAPSGNPIPAAMTVQYFMNSLRDTPRHLLTDSIFLFFIQPPQRKKYSNNVKACVVRRYELILT